MKDLVLLFSILFSVSLTAQVFVMEDGVTVNSCTGIFVDSGGDNGPYYSNESFTYTICPENAGQLVQLQFLEFATLAYWSVLSYNQLLSGEPTQLKAHFSLKRLPLSFKQKQEAVGKDFVLSI